MQLLSLLLETKIRIKQILPNDSVRLADEYTLLITDFVIETEDGRIANLEIQKIGYAFPGQRTACYSADLLLRQYKRVKDRKRRESKKFNYRDLKKVYTIVLFEKSTREFHEIPGKYLHYGEHTYDTGLKLETLQKSVLVALDIFQKNIENRSIENKLEKMDRNTVSYMIEELEAEVKAAEERAEQERQEREAAEERAKQQIAELQERIRRLESAKKEELE